MTLHLTADMRAEESELARDMQSSRCTSTPILEMLFDVIQVCEISLSVASRQQFDASWRGPLNSLIPHSGLLVWEEGDECKFGDLKLLHIGTGVFGQLISNEDNRLLLLN